MPPEGFPLMDIWKDLWPLRQNKLVHIEQITFGLLWELAGARATAVLAPPRPPALALLVLGLGPWVLGLGKQRPKSYY